MVTVLAMRITIDIGPSPSTKLNPGEVANLIDAATHLFRVMFPRDPTPLRDFEVATGTGCACMSDALAALGINIPHRSDCPKGGHVAKSDDDESPEPPASGAV